MSIGASLRREHRIVALLASAAVMMLLALTMHHFLPQLQADADHCLLCALMHGMDPAVCVLDGEAPVGFHFGLSLPFDTPPELRPLWPSWSHRGPPHCA